MVQSSIVIPETNKALKRTTQESATSTELQNEEVKRPRLDNVDAATKQRNKRLFGTLLGTLNKFKNDVEKTSDIDKKRQAIQEKLQEKLEAEKRELAEKLRAREEEQLRQELEKKEQEQRLLEEKRELSEIKQQEKLANFLKTTTEPILYYLPERLTEEMSNTIKEQKEKALEARNQFELKYNDDNNSEMDDRRRRHLHENGEEAEESEKIKSDMADTPIEETEEDINGDAVKDAVTDAPPPTEDVAEAEQKEAIVEQTATANNDKYDMAIEEVAVKKEEEIQPKEQ